MNEQSATKIIQLLERQNQLLERIIQRIENIPPAGWSAGDSQRTREMFNTAD